jgi:DNA-binding NarL/FixJ family response regulator
MVTGLINKRKISIAVADDSPIMRQMLSLLIEKDERFILVGVFENGSELISNIKEKRCSQGVCLLDIMMPKYNGIETARILKVQYPELLIFGYSSFHEGPLVDEMYQNGTKRVFQKGKWTITQLLDVIYEECIDLY